MEGVFIKSYFGGIVSNVINKTLKKKFNFNPCIGIDEVEISEKDEWVNVKFTANIRKEDFNKLMEEVIK